MAKLPEKFTATDREQMGSYDAFQKGSYDFQIVKSEIVRTQAAKEAKDDSGLILKMQAQVLAGDFKKRIVFISLNIVNDNEETVEIANKELTSITLGCGLESIEDSSELHGIPFTGTIKVEVDENGKYPDKNVFTKYEIYSGKTVEKVPGKVKKGGKKKKPVWKK